MATNVRNDYAVLTARHMRSQAQLMFTGFIASLPLAMYASSLHCNWVVTYALPALICVSALIGLWATRRKITEQTPVDAARKMIGNAWKICALVAGLGGLWALMGWRQAPPEIKIYFPAVMSLGALTLGYCLTAVRAVGLSALVLSLGPTTVALILTGDSMNGVLAGAITIAAGFQIVMMKRHQNLLQMLVEERHRSRELARVDPLTGLENRRALLEAFSKLAEARSEVRLMVIDIDRFKAINDRFGHDVGDEVLREFAILLSVYARGDICAARLGGEEFALLAPASVLDRAIAQQILAEIRSAPMPHGEYLSASIGISEAVVFEPADWNALYGRADTALYVAKNKGRDCVVIDHAAPGESQSPDIRKSPVLRSA